MMMTLKLLMQTNIACANTIHDLDSVHTGPDEWPSEDSVLNGQALEIRLLCEAAAKECHATIQVIEALMSHFNAAGEVQFVEMECRQELAIEAMQSLSEILLKVEEASGNKDMIRSIMEAKKRCDRIVGRVLCLKDKVWQLKRLSNKATGAQEYQQQIQS